MKLQSVSDLELVDLLLQKNDSALRELVHRYEKKLHNFVYKKLRSNEVAQEVVQDVFIELFDALRGYKKTASLQTYLFTIANYKAIDYIRKQKIKRVLFSAIPPFILERIKTILIDDEIEKNELGQKIGTVIQKLPNDYKLIIRLKYMEGYQVERIAQEMSLSFKATESLLYRARKAFINLYKKST